MMTKVINRHRQWRDSRDPEQSLEIDREQLKAAPRRTRNLVTARPKRHCDLDTYSVRNAAHGIVLLSVPSIAAPVVKQ